MQIYRKKHRKKCIITAENNAKKMPKRYWHLNAQIFSWVLYFYYPFFLYAPPLVCSAPGAESNSIGGLKKFCPLNFFSAPSKINPGDASVYY
jgi:hypothetical protein